MLDLSPTPAYVARLWARIDVRGPDDCWPFAGSTRSGYGQIKLGGVTYCSHRVACWCGNGPFSQELLVLHRCDNPPCCNPAHLYAGTAADNAADAVARGRVAMGERHGSARLSDSQVLDIRTRYATSVVTMAALAREYGVSRTTIMRLIRHWARRPTT